MISDSDNRRKKISKGIISAVLSASVILTGLQGALIQRAAAEPTDEVVIDAEIPDEAVTEETVQPRYTVVDQFALLSGSPFSSLNVIYDSFLGDLTGMVRSWYIAIDDTAVARAPSCEMLTALLDRILADYSAENALETSFAQNITVSYGYVSDKLPFDMDVIYETLCPDAENGLTVNSTVYYEEIEKIAHETLKLEDPNLYPYESGEVIEAGSDGEIYAVTKLTFTNGKLSDIEAQEQILSEPVAAIVVEGTKEYTYESTGEYRWPVRGRISSYFGYRSGTIGSSFHKGIDITGKYGTNLRAADSGTVTHAGWLGGYGYLVEITHDNGDVTRYGHCSDILVSKGERVYQGEVIAKMGSTGVSSGNHCDFRIKLYGTFLNPLNYL